MSGRCWLTLASDLGVRFEGVYENMLDADRSRVAGGALPCVLAETPSGLARLLKRAEIESSAKDRDRFASRLRCKT